MKLKLDLTPDKRSGYKRRKKFDLAKSQRLAKAHLQQYQALSDLYHVNTGFYIPATSFGPNNNLGRISSLYGESLYRQLLAIEKKAHKFAEDCCNVEVPEHIQDKTCDLITSQVLHLFNGSLRGFYLNLDPRGSALKISSEETHRLRQVENIKLVTDWGGYGLLAPSLED